MIKYIFRRFLWIIPIWLIVGTIAFFIMHLAPGDPAITMLGIEATTQGIDITRERLGLNKPLVIQYGDWMKGLIKGDFGETFFLGRSVSRAMVERLPVTASLAICAIIIGVLIGVPLGVIASVKPNTLRDITIMGISLLGVSVPEFIGGLLLIFLLTLRFGWLPVGGYVPLTESFVEWLKHMIMPAFVLGFMQAALISRMTRSAMIEILTSDYVRTARSKGLRECTVLWKHAFRNAAIPVVTVIGVSFALLWGGAFITEVVFCLPGIGNLLVFAAKRRDYPIVQGVLMFTATAVLLINLLADVIYVWLDPRIKYK